MNIDDDYDNDGNNIVPCPICLDVYCPSKEDGKCPQEDEFAKHYLNTPDTEWSAESKIYDAFCMRDMDALTNAVIELKTRLQTSRDTYWKERVSGLKMEMEDMLERGGWSNGQQEQLRELFTNEDNLK